LLRTRTVLPPDSGVTPFLALPRAALRLIRTADATWSVRAGLRNTAAGWRPAGRHRKNAINQLATLGEDRFTRHRA
jgi:hypothetical protein